MALVHSRFSTNTLGSWDLAHPFHYLAHNGEINTVRGNTQWMHAREPQLRSAQLGDDLPKLFPLIDERWSDSAALDAAFELLVLAGRAPAHALAMLIPAAWSQATPMPDDLRAFYEFHAGMLEPWDGPAAIAFCDGRQAGATLDRNGLRPCRYQVTRDGLLVLASEAGVLDLDPAEVVVNDRLRPGPDADRRHRRRAHPRRRGDQARARAPPPLPRAARRAEDLPRGHPLAAGRAARAGRARARPAALRLQRARSCATSSRRWRATARSRSPRWASTRRWPRSRERPRLLRGFFKQLFAQVTNPAIDPQRETLVMSLRTAVGAQGNLLDESPDHARRLAMAQPVLTSGDLAKLRALPRDRFRTVTLECTFDARGGGRALERALDALCRRASRAIALGEEILVLSDRARRRARRRADPGPARHRGRAQPPRARGLAHEVRPDRRVGRAARGHGLRAARRLRRRGREPVRRARPRGRAVGRRRGRLGDAPRAPSRATCRRSARACSRCSPRWASRPCMSYRGAQLFECVGLSADVVARYFTGTPSRVGGIGLEQIAADVAAPPRARAGRRRARPGRRLRLPPARRAPRLEPRGHHGAAARRARRAPRELRGVRDRRRRGEPARRRAARADGARPGGRAACRSTRSSRRARSCKRFAIGRDVARLDLEGGPRDARDRAQPPRRPLEQRRGRRGRAALAARRQRRLAPLGDQAGGLGALRRDDRLPGRRRRAADQGLAGREARRGRPAARPQGRRRDRAAAPLDAGRGPDLAAAAPRHLLDRGSRPADPRPALRQPDAPRSASSSSRSPASAPSPPASPRPAPTTS